MGPWLGWEDNKIISEDKTDLALLHYNQQLARNRHSRTPNRIVRLILRTRSGDGALTLRPWFSEQSAIVQEHVSGSFVSNVSAGSSALITSYARGDWDSADLYEVMQCLLDLESKLLSRRVYLPNFKPHAAPQAVGVSDINSVALHYDLPSSLFDGFLSAGSYSAASLRRAPDDFNTAYQRHFRHIVGSLQLAPQSTILDLGSGWANFAQFLVSTTNHSVECFNISQKQVDHTIEVLGGHPRVKIHHEDFLLPEKLPREVDGIVMIESVEHCGHTVRGAFLSELHGRYPKARLVIQATVQAGRGALRRSMEPSALTDLIFPGPGRLPTAKQLSRELREAGYEIEHVSDLTTEYAVLALNWLDRLIGLSEDEAGVDLALLRMMRIYAASTAASLDKGLVRSKLYLCRPAQPRVTRSGSSGTRS